MEPQLDDEIAQFLRNINNTNQEGATDQNDTEEVIDVYFVRREEGIAPEGDIVDAAPAPVQSNGPSAVFTTATIFFSVGLLVSAIALQIFLAFNPPVATVTIVPSVHMVTVSATVPLGRLIHPFTLSQSQTTPTTGKRHQDARAAQGTLTFYNGLFTAQTVPAGTILTDANGVQIATDQEADVPAGDPPSYGQATVTAHAVQAGESGNIAAYDINQACCANAILVKNTAAFTAGQNERDFRTVTRGDITSVSTLLKTSLAQSVQGALQGQLQPSEQLSPLPCTPVVTSDRQPGDEASQVHVTASLTCSAVAYNSVRLHAQAQALLSLNAAHKMGSGYSLFGQTQVSATQVVAYRPMVLSFVAQGMFVYGLSNVAQTRMKKAIAGKSTGEALHVLSALPGVRSASTSWDANTKLPKDARYIHFIIVIPGA